MAATATESMAAIKVIQALSLQDRFSSDFSGQCKRDQQESIKGARLSAKLERTIDVLVALGTASVLWYGARLVLLGELTPGSLLVFLTYLKRSFRPAQDFAKYTARLSKAAAAGERVLDLLDRTPEVQDLPHATAAPVLRGSICFDAVTFAYEPRQLVLDNLQLEIGAGCRVAIVGPSGIGKSTLLSLMLRLYDPQRGRVLIDGRDIRDYTLASLRAQISIVLQDNLLFAANVWDNIRYGDFEATRDEIETAARLANAHDFIVGLPQGYDTVLGERGATLSHGQRQRIAVARAAVRQTPILILDEPCTGLDQENELAVTQALDRLACGRTTLLVTHDLLQAARADEICYLDRGRVIEHGTHAKLTTADGYYAAAFRLQSIERRRQFAESDRMPADRDSLLNCDV
jgi:ATP-binding cassette subfamily B protein